MHRKPTFILLALAASLVAALAGTARAANEPGVGDTSILLGGTVPLTGQDSAYASIARGAEAYFAYVNAKGGVNGRTIVYKAVDDGSDQTVDLPLTRQLVEQDKVFAVFGSFGTAGTLSVRPYLNGLKVPQVFVGSGANVVGSDYAQYPYTFGFQPGNKTEGWVYGKYVARTAPAATVAVLFSNDEDGREHLAGLKQGLQRAKAKVIAAEPYDPLGSLDLSAQIASLRSSGADTLAIFATASFAIEAYRALQRLGWKPKRLIAAASPATAMQEASDGGRNKVVNGAISVAYVKDPTDPRWKKNAGMALYRSVLARYEPGADPEDSLHVIGMAAAWTMVEALRKAGRNLSRSSLQKVLDTFTAARCPFLLPGIAVKTAGNDHVPIEQMLLQRWQGGTWRSFGGLWTYRAG